MKKNIYILNLSRDDVSSIEIFIKEHIDKYFIVKKGQIDKMSNFTEIINFICNNNTEDFIVLHIIGHGVMNSEKTNSIGIEFLTWSEFGSQICKLKKSVKVLQINMLGVCYSGGFAESFNCFDKIWYTTEEADIYPPIKLYENNYTENFEAYLSEYDTKGYFGFKVKENK